MVCRGVGMVCRGVGMVCRGVGMVCEVWRWCVGCGDGV